MHIIKILRDTKGVMATKTRGGSKYIIYLKKSCLKIKKITFTKPLLLGRDLKKYHKLMKKIF